MEIGWGGLLAVAAIALAAPLLADLIPKLRIPAVAIEIVIGMVVGPGLLALVKIDVPLQVFSTVGLAYLLFLGGLEIDVSVLRGRFARIAALWMLSFAIALGCGFTLQATGLLDAPILIAIALSATSLGLVVPILHSTGELSTPFGQLVLGAASVGEFGALLLISVFFATDGNSPSQQLVLVGFFALAAVVGALGIARAQAGVPLMSKLDRMADTASQVRVRAVIVVMLSFVALASFLGFEAILGAFTAGVLLRFFDRDGRLEEEKLRHKIEAVGYGFLVPMFFVVSGMRIDVRALFAKPRDLVLVPLLLGAMFLARALPALFHKRAISARRAWAAGLLQATNLTFMVIVSSIGLAVGRLDDAAAAAMVLAGLASVLLFPPIAIALIPEAGPLSADWDESLVT